MLKLLLDLPVFIGGYDIAQVATSGILFNACARLASLAKGHHTVAQTLARMLEVRHVQRCSIKVQHIKGHHVKDLDPSCPWGHADVL